MLNANSNNLMLEEEVSFHGKPFHRMVFSMQTEKWGKMIQHAFVRRTGKLVYTIQISFPDKNYDPSNHQLSSELIELDKNLKIEGQ